tara:strand:- start:219 stop:404 length:186 start_codon:yes stop_codon:yes gene_type:complete
LFVFLRQKDGNPVFSVFLSVLREVDKNEKNNKRYYCLLVFSRRDTFLNITITKDIKSDLNE